MTAKHAVLLFAAGLLLTIPSACSGGENDGVLRHLNPGPQPVQEAVSHTITLPDQSLDGLEKGQRLATGDVDGDGVDDLVIGVPGADSSAGGRQDAGQVFVLSGGGLPEEFDVADHSSTIIEGATPGDGLGFAVATGDLNGDGIHDIVTSAIGSNGIPEVRTDMGEVYIFFGGDSLTDERDLLKEEYDVLLQPAEGFSRLGASLAVGDVNGDEIADLAIGAPYAGRAEGSPVGSQRTTNGEVYVVFGRRDLTGIVNLGAGEQDVRLKGRFAFDQFGQSVSIGDADRDGLGDVVIGAPGYDLTSELEDAGAVFGFTIRDQTPDPITAEEADWTITGSVAGSRVGSLVSVPEFARSGLFVSAPTLGVPDRAGCGVLYRVADQDGNSLIESVAAASYTGSSAGEFFPAAAASFNSPAGPILAIGSPGAESGVGAVFVVNGSVEGQVDLAAPPVGSSILVGYDGQGLGAALAIGDIDGDSGADVAILSGPGAGSARGAGTVYVLSL